MSLAQPRALDLEGTAMRIAINSPPHSAIKWIQGLSLTPRCERKGISLYNIDTISYGKLKRGKKNINWKTLFDTTPNSESYNYEKKVRRMDI